MLYKYFQGQLSQLTTIYVNSNIIIFGFYCIFFRQQEILLLENSPLFNDLWKAANKMFNCPTAMWKFYCLKTPLYSMICRKRQIPVLSPCLPSMILQNFEFPHPFPLNLKKSWEFSPTLGQRI